MGASRPFLVLAAVLASAPCLAEDPAPAPEKPPEQAAQRPPEERKRSADEFLKRAAGGPDPVRALREHLTPEALAREPGLLKDFLTSALGPEAAAEFLGKNPSVADQLARLEAHLTPPPPAPGVPGAAPDVPRGGAAAKKSPPVLKDVVTTRDGVIILDVAGRRAKALLPDDPGELPLPPGSPPRGRGPVGEWSGRSGSLRELSPQDLRGLDDLRLDAPSGRERPPLARWLLDGFERAEAPPFDPASPWQSAFGLSLGAARDTLTLPLRDPFGPLRSPFLPSAEPAAFAPPGTPFERARDAERARESSTEALVAWAARIAEGRRALRESAGLKGAPPGFGAARALRSSWADAAWQDALTVLTERYERLNLARQAATDPAARRSAFAGLTAAEAGELDAALGTDFKRKPDELAEARRDLWSVWIEERGGIDAVPGGLNAGNATARKAFSAVGLGDLLDPAREAPLSMGGKVYFPPDRSGTVAAMSREDYEALREKALKSRAALEAKGFSFGEGGALRMPEEGLHRDALKGDAGRELREALDWLAPGLADKLADPARRRAFAAAGLVFAPDARDGSLRAWPAEEYEGRVKAHIERFAKERDGLFGYLEARDGWTSALKRYYEFMQGQLRDGEGGGVAVFDETVKGYDIGMRHHLNGLRDLGVDPSVVVDLRSMQGKLAAKAGSVAEQGARDAILVPVAGLAAAAVAPKMVLVGGALGVGLSGTRQAVQVYADGSRKEFNAQELWESGMMGALLGPAAKARPIAMTLGLMGTYQGFASAGAEAKEGHGWTAAFDGSLGVLAALGTAVTARSYRADARLAGLNRAAGALAAEESSLTARLAATTDVAAREALTARLTQVSLGRAATEASLKALKAGDVAGAQAELESAAKRSFFESVRRFFGAEDPHRDPAALEASRDAALKSLRSLFTDQHPAAKEFRRGLANDIGEGDFAAGTRMVAEIGRMLDDSLAGKYEARFTKNSGEVKDLDGALAHWQGAPPGQPTRILADARLAGAPAEDLASLFLHEFVHNTKPTSFRGAAGPKALPGTEQAAHLAEMRAVMAFKKMAPPVKAANPAQPRGMAGVLVESNRELLAARGKLAFELEGPRRGYSWATRDPGEKLYMQDMQIKRLLRLKTAVENFDAGTGQGLRLKAPGDMAYYQQRFMPKGAQGGMPAVLAEIEADLAAARGGRSAVADAIRQGKEVPADVKRPW